MTLQPLDYTGATTGTVAAGTIQLGTTVGGEEIVAAAAYENAKAVVVDVPGPDGKTYTSVTFTAAGSRIKATLNETGLIVRAETLPGDAVTGKDPVVITYADYRDVDGIKFPFRIIETRGGRMVVDLTLSDVRPNAGFYVEPPAGIATR